MAAFNDSRFPDFDDRSILQLCAGGLMTTGGLGWCLHLAYTKQPKVTIAAYAIGSAGICLSNMAFLYPPSGSGYRIPPPNWLFLLSGTMLSGSCFGYCIALTMKEHPKSTMIGYIIGSLGYCIANAVLFTNMFGNSEDAPKFRYREDSSKDIADAVGSSNARFHYMGDKNQCQKCKEYVEKDLRKRRIETPAGENGEEPQKICPGINNGKSRDIGS